MGPADQWAADLADWAIPQAIVDAAPESPWFHDPAAFAVNDTLVRDSVSAVIAREALSPSGTVLDVGVGGGRASLALTPEVRRIVGVDSNANMLASFRQAAESLGVPALGVLGPWPDVALEVEPADVVVCHHVLYNVGDIAPFIRALTNQAIRRVVVEITTAHPTSAMNAAWLHFHGLMRPTSPTWRAAVEVCAALGLEVEAKVSPSTATRATVPSSVAFVRRRLCLPKSRDAELAEWLAAHPPPSSGEVATLWWPGAARVR